MSGINFGGRPWNATPLDVWLEWAGNPNFPDYQRVTFVAHGRVGANGHAPLEPGELAHYLIRKTGAIPDRRVVHDAIQKAVRLGYLDPGSRMLCLVLDSSRSQYRFGDKGEPCGRSHGHRRQNVRTGAGRFGENVRSGTRRSPQNVRSGAGRFEASPSGVQAR